jgi:hypothetical protein
VRVVVRRGVAWGLLLVVGLAGCGAAAIEDAAYHGARGGVRGTVDEVRTLPEVQALKDLAVDVDVTKAARDVAQAVVEGAGDGVKTLELDQQIQILIQAVMSSAKSSGNELVASLLEQQGPRIERLARDTLAGTIQGAGDQLKRTAETDLTRATSAVIGSAVDALVTALEAEKVQQLEAGLIETTGDLTESASAGAVRGLRDELAKQETQAAFGDLSKRVASDAASGLKEGLGLDAGVSRDWRLVAIGLGVFLLLVAAALVFFIYRSIVTARTLSLVAQRINKSGTPELKSDIKKKAEEKKLERFLANFLLDRGL